MVIIGILVAIIIFSLVVIIHELGHFFTARKFGVKVEEFGLGLPPRAKKLFTDKKGTIYSLNWLPIGGFVRLTGESPNSYLVYDENKKLFSDKELEKAIKEGKDIFLKDGKKLHKTEIEEIKKGIKENEAEYNLSNKPAWKQSIVMLAGVFMNFFLAFLVFFILFLIGVKPIGINDKIQMDSELKLIPTYQQALNNGIIQKFPGVMISPTPGSVSEEAGLKYGDVIYEVLTCESGIIDYKTCTFDGLENRPFEPVYARGIFEPQDFIELVTEYAGNTIYVMINKGVDEQYIKIDIPEEGKIGVYLGENIQLNTEFRYKYSVIDSAKYAFLETKNQVVLTFKSLGYLIDKIFSPENPEEREEAIKAMSGPIGIVDFISESLRAGVIFLAVFSAIISINLGVFNLLPIPALDGGRFFIILINSLSEKLFKKKIIGLNTEAIIHTIFFIILIALSLIIAYNDISKIIGS